MVKPYFLYFERCCYFRETEFTQSGSATIFCGTWNVNAKKQEGGLHKWLLPNYGDHPASTNSFNSYADIYAVGFQEIVDLNAVNVAINSSNTQQRSQFWQEHIQECLNRNNTGHSYTLLMEKHLVGLLLCIYVKSHLLQVIKDVRGASTGVGIMGMLGNKGGVAIRFSLYDSPICFVCAHLAAHRENIAGRNSDYKNIIERTVFTVDSNNATLINSSGHRELSANGLNMPYTGAAKYYEKELHILEHEIVFWIGDLNYRIDSKIPTEEVFSMIDKNNLLLLRAYDQLNIERLRSTVLQGFTEGELLFKPTYKYQPGTDIYEMRAEKKLRAPAWCDRILWRTKHTLDSKGKRSKVNGVSCS